MFDTATSAITWVRIHGHRLAGEPLPEGVALTADGEPTVDPVEALNGILLPMSGHRGFGLSIMWEVLTGVLSGCAAFATDFPPDGPDQPEGGSAFLLAIDPTAAMPYDAFVNRVDTLIDAIHGSRRLPGTDRILVPGDRSAEIREELADEGVPVPADLLAKLRDLGKEFDVSL